MAFFATEHNFILLLKQKLKTEKKIVQVYSVMPKIIILIQNWINKNWLLYLFALTLGFNSTSYYITFLHKQCWPLYDYVIITREV